MEILCRDCDGFLEFFGLLPEFVKAGGGKEEKEKNGFNPSRI